MDTETFEAFVARTLNEARTSILKEADDTGVSLDEAHERLHVFLQSAAAVSAVARGVEAGDFSKLAIDTYFEVIEQALDEAEDDAIAERAASPTSH